MKILFLTFVSVVLLVYLILGIFLLSSAVPAFSSAGFATKLLEAITGLPLLIAAFAWLLLYRNRSFNEKRLWIDARTKGIANSFIFLVIFAFIFLILIGITWCISELGFGQFDFLLDAALGFAFSLSALTYLRMYKKLSWKEIKDSIGISRKNVSWYVFWIGIVAFLIIMMVSLAATAFGGAVDTPINTNVGMTLAGAPIWFYIFVAVIEPINEEILFRGLMVPSVGIIISGVVFGLLHSSYNSTFAVEVIVACFFGLISGYIFKKTKSLYPSIIAHILVNSIAVVSLLLFVKII